MKTIRNKFQLVYDFENLFYAHKQSRKSKRDKGEIINFELSLNSNLIDIQEELINQTYQLGEYRLHVVYEPKKRLIMSLPYRDRVTQYSFCQHVIEPYFHSRLQYDNCASQKEKGTHYGLKRVERHMRNFYHRHGTEGWILKGDISKYFYTIPHDVLKQIIYPKVEDQQALWFLEMTINSSNNPKLLKQLEYFGMKHNLPVLKHGVGLPIGLSTSQWFAVIFLDELGKFIKEELKIKYYSHYMDDFVLIHPSKEYLKDCLIEIDSFVTQKLKLTLNPKTQIFPLRNGVDYLGFHTYLTETGKVIRKIRRDSKTNMKRKVKAFNRKYQKGEITLDKIKQSVKSWMGHAEHGHTYHLRKKVWQSIILRGEEE